jgi:hypothetical protein
MTNLTKLTTQKQRSLRIGMMKKMVSGSPLRSPTPGVRRPQVAVSGNAPPRLTLLIRENGEHL